MQMTQNNNNNKTLFKTFVSQYFQSIKNLTDIFRKIKYKIFQQNHSVV